MLNHNVEAYSCIIVTVMKAFWNCKNQYEKEIICISRMKNNLITSTMLVYFWCLEYVSSNVESVKLSSRIHTQQKTLSKRYISESKLKIL